MPDKQTVSKKVLVPILAGVIVVVLAVAGYFLFRQYQPVNQNTSINEAGLNNSGQPEVSTSTSVVPFPGDYSDEQALVCAKQILKLPAASLPSDLLKDAIWNINSGTYGYWTNLSFDGKDVKALYNPAGLGGFDYGIIAYDGKNIIVSKKGERINDYDYTDICIFMFREANTSTLNFTNYYLNNDFTMINSKYDNAPASLTGDEPGAKLKLAGVIMPASPSSGTKKVAAINGLDVMLGSFYYITLSNGRWAIYDPITIGDTATISYDDGTSATVSSFRNDTNRGCGSVLPSIAISNGLTKDSLVNIGKLSSGELIYEYKDETRARELYDTIYYPDPNTGEKISYEKFIGDKPYFFWIDGFGSPIMYVLSKYQPAAECGKPVIYLYPEKDMNISVKVSPNGGFKITEPTYNDGWNVWATTKSELTNLSDGAKYPYLFWEGSAYNYKTPSQGFVLKRENVGRDMSYLLRRLGLNEKESADFLKFWQPKLEVKSFVFVTFLPQEEFDMLAPLTVTPKPDKVIRIFMDYTPLDSYIPVAPIKIITPERTGFTVVEWGGRLR